MYTRVQEGGIYRHFKGDMYVVLAVLKSSSTPDNETQDIVSYMNLRTGERYWRSYRSSLDGFITPKENADGSGEEIERFTFWGMADEVKLVGDKYHVTISYY